MSMTTNKQTLREEISNPAIGTREHLRKLALALLDELEASHKSNEFLKGQLSELANFNPDWDKLEASYESWREIAAELLVAKVRISELEAAERRNAELAHHLKSAHQFIEHTEAFGYMAASGILQCGDAKWDVDASKESLRAAATDKGE